MKMTRHELYQQFQHEFPIETLRDMPLEKYQQCHDLLPDSPRSAIGWRARLLNWVLSGEETLSNMVSIGLKKILEL